MDYWFHLAKKLITFLLSIV